MAPRETPRRPDAQTASEPVFERFQLDIEPMGDGRLIHYYRWPASEPDPDRAPTLSTPPHPDPDV